jgi:hypothetical protein
MSSACSRCGTQLPGKLVRASWSGRGEKGGGVDVVVVMNTWEESSNKEGGEGWVLKPTK